MQTGRGFRWAERQHLAVNERKQFTFLSEQFPPLLPHCHIYYTRKYKCIHPSIFAYWTIWTADIPYTLIVPKIDVRNIEKPRLKEFMLEHLVPGKIYDSYSGVGNSKEEEESFGNGNGHKIVFRKLEKSHNNVWLLNGQQILYKLRINENLMAIAIDGYLGDRKSPYSKRNIQETNKWVLRTKDTKSAAQWGKKYVKNGL